MYRVKAFTNDFVSGNGGGGPVASHSLLGAPLRYIVSCCTGSLQGEKPYPFEDVRRRRSGVVPFLKASDLEHRLG
jgi:hypothetical protein